MSNPEFKPGDTVTLKSGGPTMTIDHFSDTVEQYSCSWFDKSNRKQEWFEPHVLSRHQPTAPSVVNVIP